MDTVPNLTRRQRQILEFIKARFQRSGFSPTIAEIQEKFEFKSPNAVQEHLKALENKRCIRRTPNKWRGLEVVGAGQRTEQDTLSSVTVPIVGHIAAGSPILAEENREGTISVDRSLVRDANKLFALRVQGESMVKAGICNGDIIIARQQTEADNGHIVVALLADDAAVKRFKRQKNAIFLTPENDRMEPIKINKGSEFKILGKVIANMRRI